MNIRSTVYLPKASERLPKLKVNSKSRDDNNIKEQLVPSPSNSYIQRRLGSTRSLPFLNFQRPLESNTLYNPTDGRLTF